MSKYIIMHSGPTNSKNFPMHLTEAITLQHDSYFIKFI